jgi:hypothetical protein
MKRLGCALFLLLTSTTAVAQTPSPTGYDLQGIGDLEFQFDTDAFKDYGPALSQAPIGVLVTIGADGVVTACNLSSAASEPATAAAQRLCVAIRLGHFVLPAWYTPYMHGGHIGLSLSASRGVVPVKPIRFVNVAQGEPTNLMFLFGKCFLGKPSMARVDDDAVCAAFEAAGRPNLTGTPPTQSAHFGLPVQPDAHPYLSYTYPQIADRGLNVEFAPMPASDGNFLSASDGRIVASIGQYDYPPLALREGLEGQVKVLLGYDRTGTARSCRPLRV